MNDDRQKRITRILKRPKPPTDAELAKRLERHKLPATIEEIEAGTTETRATAVTKQKLLFNPCDYQ